MSLPIESDEAQLPMVFYIDVCTKPDSANPAASHRDLRAAVQDWFTQRYIQPEEPEVVLPVNRTLRPDPTFQDLILFLHINAKQNCCSVVCPKNCVFEVNVYSLFPKHQIDTLSNFLGLNHESDAESLPLARLRFLPNGAFEDTWENLVFEPRIQDDIFNCLFRLLSIKYLAGKGQEKVSNLMSLSIFLFWGPPGSGKTSLCKALAQKLSIRTKDQYSRTRLVELTSHNMYSKFFSESANMVEKTIDAIAQLLDKEPQSLVIVLIDEIESIAGSRDDCVSGNEPKDAMRAVNALLTGLDRLRAHPNLFVFCTSNLIGAMDSAFLDRVDFQWHIPSPCARARYEILRQRLSELSDIGWIRYGSQGVSPVNLQEQDFEDFVEVKFMDSIPEFGTMLLRYSHQDNHPANKLWGIAQKSELISGRGLQRLPALALALHSNRYPCPLEFVLEGLDKIVQESGGEK